MNRLLTLLLLLAVGAYAAEAKPRPEIMGIPLSMGREAAHARLKAIGRLEKEERKRQEAEL